MKEEIHYYRFLFGIYILILGASVISIQAILDAIMPLSWLKDLTYVFVVVLATWWLLRAVDIPKAIPLFVEVGVVAIISFIVFLFHSDYSFDGVHYHLPATISLLNGWNPTQQTTGGIWADHYPHGIWLLRAQVAKITGNVESGRIINVLFAIASYYLFTYYLVMRKQRPLVLLERSLSFFCAFGPIVIAEILTNCVDGVLASLFLCLVSCLLLSCERTVRKYAIIGAVASSILLINSKMSGPFFAVLAIALLLAIQFYQSGFTKEWMRSNFRRGAFLFCGGCFAVVVVGYRPYLTNILDHGVLIYPPSNEILSEFIPKNLEGANSATKLLYAVFGETGGSREGVTLKAPGKVSFLEIANSTGFSTAGGFGPWFGLFVIVVMTLFVFALWRDGWRNFDQEITLVGLSIILICILFPEAFAARYIPILPTGVLFLLLAMTTIQPSRLVAPLCTLLFLLNLTPFVAKALWSGHLIHNRIEREVLDIRAAANGKVVRISADGKGSSVDHYVAQILKEYGVAAEFLNCEIEDKRLVFYTGYPKLCVKAS